MAINGETWDVFSASALFSSRAPAPDQGENWSVGACTGAQDTADLLARLATISCAWHEATPVADPMAATAAAGDPSAVTVR